MPKKIGRTSTAKKNRTGRPADYWVLALSKGHTRLLRLRDGKLTEIDDKNFPLEYEEQFQYESPSSPRKVLYFSDESRIGEVRLHAFFRHIGHVLEPYLKKGRVPIILMTVNAHVSEFKRNTRLDDRIVRNIHGNYDHHRVSELKTLLWKRLKLDREGRHSG